MKKADDFAKIFLAALLFLVPIDDSQLSSFKPTYGSWVGLRGVTIFAYAILFCDFIMHCTLIFLLLFLRRMQWPLIGSVLLYSLIGKPGKGQLVSKF